MKHLKKIVGINLVVLLVYSAIIRLVVAPGDNDGKSIGILIISAVVISFHVIVNLLIMIFYYLDKNKALGNAWLLSAGIVLLVGFSTCWGNASI